MIFLDFGLSRFVKEDIGEKTITRFVGSLHITSPEMRKTYYLKKAMWVDLYYNDQWGLEQLYSYFKFNAQNSMERKILNENMEGNYMDENLVEIVPTFCEAYFFELKFAILAKDFERMKQIL